MANTPRANIRTPRNVFIGAVLRTSLHSIVSLRAGLTGTPLNPYREEGSGAGREPAFDSIERMTHDCPSDPRCSCAQEDGPERHASRTQSQNGRLRRMGHAGGVSRLHTPATRTRCRGP